MRNFILSIAAAGFLTISSAFIPAQLSSTRTVEHVQGEVCFKIKNDTGKSVTLHTGSGTRVIGNLTTQEFCLKEGIKVCLVEQGRVGKPILTVADDLKGKTLNLSSLM
ncbi:MAG: hypothetical protein NZ455_01710 [Bacteroidia bacterium]|nr:hypothetical protein [Bacteroidia bacterium]MDW8347114.1 hypothetical protein [Bacteroidia bacterium]